MKIADLKVGLIVELLMGDGSWRRARVTAVVKRKSKWFEVGHVKVDVLRVGGGIEVSDEIGLHELSKYLRLPIKYVAAEPPPGMLGDLPDPFEKVREVVATAWLDEIVRELGCVSIGPAKLPEGDGFEASIDVPDVGDYAVGFGMNARAAVQEAAENARNRDVRK